MMNVLDKIGKFKELNSDYLTFYHELRMPQNEFFSSKENRDDNTQMLMISSPSRMGNHLLISILDNHPELPRIPGEDGFLSFSFFQANYDLKRYLEYVRDQHDANYMKRLSTNLFFDKWANLKQCYLKNNVPEKYSGVNIVDRPADIDFQDTIYDVNYAAYSDALNASLNTVGSGLFSDYLNLYANALLQLDYDYSPRATRFDGFFSYSGMRSQARWVLEHYEQARLVTSLRPFDSYAISHIKSRSKNNEITDEWIQNAWEHWYHKVIDYFYLKAAYPEKVCLVSFDDLTGQTKKVAKGICRFLDVGYSKSMLTPSVFGIPVKGNASTARRDSVRGTFYNSSHKLEKGRIPEDYFHLWESFDLVKTI